MTTTDKDLSIYTHMCVLEVHRYAGLGNKITILYSYQIDVKMYLAKFESHSNQWKLECAKDGFSNCKRLGNVLVCVFKV